MKMTDERKAELLKKFANDPNKLEQKLQTIEHDLNDPEKPIPEAFNVAKPLLT